MLSPSRFGRHIFEFVILSAGEGSAFAGGGKPGMCADHLGFKLAHFWDRPFRWLAHLTLHAPGAKLSLE
jgi:hypothetical protein